MTQRCEAVVKACRLVLGLVCATISAQVSAQIGDPGTNLPRGVTREGPVTLEFSDRYRFESETLGEPFLIDVVRIVSPLAPPAPDRKVPVLFVTDNTAFSALVPSMIRADSLEGLPQMIVVGIGYAFQPNTKLEDIFFGFNARRSRDFTPTVDEAWFETIRTLSREQLGRAWPEEGTPGGAAAFLTFINDELKPFIGAHYPADLDDTAILGHSLGGLFALHVLFTSPDSFDRYIAISPAAFYDADLLFREEASLGDVDARLFIAVGGRDMPDILESVPRLDAQIRATARTHLMYTYRFFAEETHSSIVPGAIIRGLRSVFDPPSPPFEIPSTQPSE